MVSVIGSDNCKPFGELKERAAKKSRGNRTSWKPAWRLREDLCFLTSTYINCVCCLGRLCHCALLQTFLWFYETIRDVWIWMTLHSDKEAFHQAQVWLKKERVEVCRRPNLQGVGRCCHRQWWKKAVPTGWGHAPDDSIRSFTLDDLEHQSQTARRWTMYSTS